MSEQLDVGSDAPAPARRTQDRWHVGREIPLALIAGFVLQTLGGAWWLSQRL